MSGYDYFRRGLIAVDELGCDDRRALDLLRAAIESGELEAEELATAYFELGRCYHATGHQEVARQCLTTAVRYGRGPGLLADAHHVLGETLFVLKRPAEAEAALRRSLEINRQHLHATESMTMVANYVLVRSDGDQHLLNESYRLFYEAYAVLTSPTADEYQVFFNRPKALFDALCGMASCKGEMGNNKERVEAAMLHEKAERLALAHPDEIMREELDNVYRALMGLYQRMGRVRDTQLTQERARRNLG